MAYSYLLVASKFLVKGDQIKDTILHNHLLFGRDCTLLRLQVELEVGWVGVNGRAKGGSQTEVLVQL